MTEINYKELVQEMKAQGVFQKEPTLNWATRFGIALGGVTASTSYLVSGLPVVKQVCDTVGDVCTGVKLGHQVKMQQLHAQERVKMAQAQAQAAKIQDAVVAPA